MKRIDFLKAPAFIFAGSFLPSFKRQENNLNQNYIAVTHNALGETITEEMCDDIVYKKTRQGFAQLVDPRVDIKLFGAKGDGATDDSDALQKAIDACVLSGKSLYISRPVKSYLSLKKLLIKNQIYIFGDGMNLCGINFVNTDGFEVAEGAKNVIIEKLSINQAIRNSNKPNYFTAIRILGSDASRPYTHIYRDILIDGFGTGFTISYLWDSLFDNVKIVFGKVGFDVKGKSVNNIINNCSVSVEGSGSRGIYFSDKNVPSEGWRITNILVFGADVALHALYASNIYVTTPILDFCKQYGILLKPESSAAVSSNWQIIGGYIAMSGKNSAAGIKIHNDFDNNQLRGSKIANVDILVYPGANSQIPIDISGSKDKLDSLEGNTYTGFAQPVNKKN